MYNNIFQVSTEPFTSDRLATATEVLYFANLPMSDVRSVEDRAYALQDFKKWMKTNKYGNCDSKRFILKTGHRSFISRNSIWNFCVQR